VAYFRVNFVFTLTKSSGKKTWNRQTGMPESEWTRCNERLATPSSSGQDAMSGFCERGNEREMRFPGRYG